MRPKPENDCSMSLHVFCLLLLVFSVLKGYVFLVWPKILPGMYVHLSSLIMHLKVSFFFDRRLKFVSAKVKSTITLTISVSCQLVGVTLGLPHCPCRVVRLCVNLKHYEWFTKMYVKIKLQFWKTIQRGTIHDYLKILCIICDVEMMSIPLMVTVHLRKLWSDCAKEYLFNEQGFDKTYI